MLFDLRVEEVKTFFPTKEKTKAGKVKQGVRIFWRLHLSKQAPAPYNFTFTITPRWKKENSGGREVRTRYFCVRDSRDDGSLATHAFRDELRRLVPTPVAEATLSALGI